MFVVALSQYGVVVVDKQKVAVADEQNTATNNNLLNNKSKFIKMTLMIMRVNARYTPRMNTQRYVKNAI